MVFCKVWPKLGVSLLLADCVLVVLSGVITEATPFSMLRGFMVKS